jgi:hypothetical protein
VSELQHSWIEILNRQTQHYQDAGMDGYDAVAQAAADFKLSVLVDGDYCRIYRAPGGILVSCWLNDYGSIQADGSLSYDKNIQWLTNMAVEPKR